MEKSKMTTYQMAVTALMAAVLCVLGPVSVPIGPVPLSLTNLVLFITVYLLGMKYATISCAVYLALGAVGLPVFSGWQGGLAKLAGPTGGFLAGFLLLTLIGGFFWEKGEGKPAPAALGFTLGALLDYALGTFWFILVTKSGIGTALGACVLPFLPGDALKILLGVVLGSLLRKRLQRADLIR